MEISTRIFSEEEFDFDQTFGSDTGAYILFKNGWFLHFYSNSEVKVNLDELIEEFLIAGTNHMDVLLHNDKLFIQDVEIKVECEDVVHFTLRDREHNNSVFLLLNRKDDKK